MGRAQGLQRRLLCGVTVLVPVRFLHLVKKRASERDAVFLNVTARAVSGEARDMEKAQPRGRAARPSLASARPWALGHGWGAWTWTHVHSAPGRGPSPEPGPSSPSRAERAQCRRPGPVGPRWPWGGGRAEHYGVAVCPPAGSRVRRHPSQQASCVPRPPRSAVGAALGPQRLHLRAQLLPVPGAGPETRGTLVSCTSGRCGPRASTCRPSRLPASRRL